MKYLFDTNIYFAAIHDRGFLDRYRTFVIRIAPLSYLSSVVRFELLQGAKGNVARARISPVTERLERVGRIVVPGHEDWIRAAIVQGRLWDDHPSLRRKSLQNDILIACAARQVGALIITENTKDFDLVRPYLAHEALTMEQASRALGPSL